MKNDVPYPMAPLVLREVPSFLGFPSADGSRSSGWFGDVDGAIGKGQPQRQGADLPKGQRESWFRHFGEA